MDGSLEQQLQATLDALAGNEAALAAQARAFEKEKAALHSELQAFKVGGGAKGNDQLPVAIVGEDEGRPQQRRQEVSTTADEVVEASFSSRWSALRARKTWRGALRLLGGFILSTALLLVMFHDGPTHGTVPSHRTSVDGNYLVRCEATHKFVGHLPPQHCNQGCSLTTQVSTFQTFDANCKMRILTDKLGVTTITMDGGRSQRSVPLWIKGGQLQLQLHANDNLAAVNPSHGGKFVLEPYRAGSHLVYTDGVEPISKRGKDGGKFIQISQRWRRVTTRQSEPAMDVASAPPPETEVKQPRERTRTGDTLPALFCQSDRAAADKRKRFRDHAWVGAVISTAITAAN